VIGEYRGGASPDNQVLGMIREDGTGLIVDARKLQAAAGIRLPYQDIAKVAVGPAGRLLAVSRKTEPLALWDTREAVELARFDYGGEDRVIAFSQDGRWLAAAARNGVFRLWDVLRRAEAAAWRDRMEPIADLRFSADGQLLFCGHRDGTISVWNLRTGRIRTKIRPHQHKINRIALSTDGTRIASTSADRTAAVYDLRTGQEIARFDGGQSSFFRVSFSPDGETLFVNEWDNAFLFDIPSGRQVARLKSYVPVFLSERTVLGFSKTAIWHYTVR
jgi:WD40 repeat protein